MARLTWHPGHDDNDVEGLPTVGQVNDQWCSLAGFAST